MYKVCIMISIFQVMPRKYHELIHLWQDSLCMSVHISVYIMYTVCNRRYTGRYVEGVYTEFYSCGRVPSSSGHTSVYSMCTGKIKGYTECGVEGIY